MKISFSTGSNLYSSNYNLDTNSTKNDDDIKTKKRNAINSNNTYLGGKSKKNGILEGLMKQKENLINNKNEFMKNALKEGKDPKSIKEKLDDYDKQIKEIDEQVRKLELDNQHNELNAKGNDKNKNSKRTSNTSSPNDVKTDFSMDNIVALSEGLSKQKTLSQLRNKMTGNIRELKADIEYDEKFRGIDPKSSKKLLAKEENGIKIIDEKLNDSLENINNKIKENLKDNTSKNVVHKNEKNKNTSSSETINADKLLTKQMQAAENIKHYSNMLDDKNKYNGEKIDATV